MLLPGARVPPLFTVTPPPTVPDPCRVPPLLTMTAPVIEPLATSNPLVVAFPPSGPVTVRALLAFTVVPLVADTVPLLTVVLHGSCNCGQTMENGRAWQLEMLDLGTTPQTEVSMRACPPFGIPAYAGRAELMAETYRFFHGPDGVLRRMGQADIERRRELAEGVTETQYDNGLTVRVNRTPQPFGDLPSMSFTIG